MPNRPHYVVQMTQAMAILALRRRRGEPRHLTKPPHFDRLAAEGNDASSPFMPKTRVAAGTGGHGQRVESQPPAGMTTVAFQRSGRRFCRQRSGPGLLC